MHSKAVAFAQGEVLYPIGLALDPKNDDLYVADSGNGRIAVYDKETLKLKRILDQKLKRPTALYLDGDSLFVIDRADAVLRVNSSTGEILQRYGNLVPEPPPNNESKDGDLQCPVGISVDPKYVYVVDCLGGRIQQFKKRNGQFVRTIRHFKTEQPVALVVGQKIIYVADQTSSCVHRIDKSNGDTNGSIGSAPLMHAPKGITLRNPDELLVMDWSGHQVHIFERTTGNIKKSLSCNVEGIPTWGKGICADSSGVYVSDFASHRLIKLKA